MILAIDTATDRASIALADDQGLRAELSWTTRGSHSSHLARVLPELFRLEGITASTLTAVVVARGPGSFNGLRVGISTAKGLALARRIPLVGVATLDVIGWQAAEPGRSIWAVLPAGRQELYLARYHGAGDDWHRVGEYQRLSINLAAERYEHNTLLAGEARTILAAQLTQQGRPVASHDSMRDFRRAGFLAELGERYFAVNGSDQSDVLEPLYLRRSSAEENRAAQNGE